MKSFWEVRRMFPVLAAILFLIALGLPMWKVEVQAIQYPNEPLNLDLYAYPRIEGDFVEMHRLNKYIGFYYPDPVYWSPNYDVHENAVDVPEWSVGWLAFVMVSGLSLFVAVAPTNKKLKLGLICQLIGTVSVFTVMLADIQYRLYQSGHTLDPGAPVVGVDPFTPPIWGKYEVANITSYSRFGSGVYLSTVAILLLFLAFWFRNSSVKLQEVPGRIVDWFGSGASTTTSSEAPLEQ